MLRHTPTPPLAKPLRVVCAWCKREMSPGVAPTSHGLCKDCENETFGPLTLPRTLDSDIREDR